ncbi:hypothetical protein D3C79_762210 [compost metagenome]
MICAAASPTIPAPTIDSLFTSYLPAGRAISNMPACTGKYYPQMPKDHPRVACICHRQRGLAVTRQDAPTAVARLNCDMTFPAVIAAAGDIGQPLVANASATQVLQV